MVFRHTSRRACSLARLAHLSLPGWLWGSLPVPRASTLGPRAAFKVHAANQDCRHTVVNDYMVVMQEAPTSWRTCLAVTGHAVWAKAQVSPRGWD